jgi:hypothetical protein
MSPIMKNRTLLHAIEEGERRKIRELLQKTCALHREVLVARVTQQLSTVISPIVAEPIQIATLYQLRKNVGGRFALLKERWLAAGLPLTTRDGAVLQREDPLGSGWQTFVVWLLERGYQAERSTDGKNLLILKPVFESYSSAER